MNTAHAEIRSKRNGQLLVEYDGPENYTVTMEDGNVTMFLNFRPEDFHEFVKELNKIGFTTIMKEVSKQLERRVEAPSED